MDKVAKALETGVVRLIQVVIPVSIIGIAVCAVLYARMVISYL